MHFKHFSWTTEKLDQIRNDIDPKPQYQRGDAWDDKKRSLLIDSILSDFDIPKIYLRHAKSIGTFDYEVTDGQQRLKAIWRFLDDKLKLSGMCEANSHLNGKVFSELAENEKSQIRDYKFITTVVYNATNDEVRELFRRLQLGSRLTPPEIRNSIASALGNTIRAMALTHPFFENSPFPITRYKSDDLVSHAFSILLYKRTRDLKAADLEKMYHECSAGVNTSVIQKIDAILNFLNEMQQKIPRCIKTKWGFVDLVGVMATRNLTKLSASEVAESYAEWEEERAEKMSKLLILAAAPARSRNRMLYDYITAFQREGATKNNLNVRFQILNFILPK